MELIPDSWTSSRLHEVAATATGGTPLRKVEQYYGGDVAWVKSGELNDNFIGRTDEYLTSEGLSNSSAKVFSKGTLLVALYGATAGKTGILDINAATNQALCAIFPNQSLLLQHFLRYYIMHIRPKLLTQRYGGAQPNISQTIIRNIELILPPLSEQHSIATLLSLIQEGIEQQERMIALTTELKKSLMHKLFTEGTRGEPQKQTEIGLLPESWTVILFEQLATLQRGKDLIKANFQAGEIPVVGSNGIIGYHNLWNVKGPSVTVGRSGSVGKVNYYECDIWAHNTSLYVRDFHNNDARFIAYYLEYLNLSRFKTGASVPTLDRNSFRNLPIVRPTKNEQEKIGTILAQLDHKTAICIAKKSKLADLFKTLLHQLMTAQIRVNDIDLSELGILDKEPENAGAGNA